MSKNKKPKLYVRPVYPLDGVLPCYCTEEMKEIVCEPDPCHYDTWDVVCQRCGARTSQYATRKMAVFVWNGMTNAARVLKPDILDGGL